eukprot:m.135559 g.135559  ORF g.135559 m.135559 type:complete len:76 (-) comp29802_c0_seq1:1638-1865(-)
MMIDDDNDVVEAVSATVFLVSPPPLPTDAVCVDYSDALKQVRACVRTCVRACVCLWQLYFRTIKYAHLSWIQALR